MKKKIYYIVILLASLAFIFLLPKTFKQNNTENVDNPFYLAKVIEIQSDETEEINDYEQRTVTFVAKISLGLRRGSYQIVKQNIDNDFIVESKPVQVGDSVLISKMDEDEHFIFVAKSRIFALGIMLIVFIIMILLIGKKQGVITIVTLLLTTMALFFVLIPAILSGINIYLITASVVIFIIITSITMLSGFEKKGLSAILGNILGITIAAILANIFNKFLGITGIVNEEYIFLALQEETFKIDLIAVVWSSIIIGSLGAVMDVAISISSALEEVAKEMDVPSKSKLIKSGMNIGRDIIGTMTNTLILAYVGSSLAMLLLFVLYNRNMLFLLNMEMIVVEISQAVVGSMAVIITVPSTVLVSALFYSSHENKEIE